MICSSCYS